MSRRLLEHLNHELRSPMTVIVGMTDLLLLRTLEDEPRQCLQSVKRAADMLLRILDEAVELSRLEAGNLTLGQTEFALADVIERVRKTIGPLRLEVAIAPSVPARLVGDADRLMSLLLALTRSATKVRSATAYKLCVAADTANQGVVNLHLALGDLDRPFDATTVPPSAGGRPLRLADFFERGFFGAGLGLPVSAGVASLMNGQLWMADDGKAPALFHCSGQFGLPGSSSLGNLLETVAERLDAGPSGPRSRRVLLVEDTAANRQFFASALQQRGHTAVGVGDGERAISVFQSQNAGQPFDLVLIDLEMPVLDGWQTAAALRKLDAFQARPVPLVALTAHSVENDEEISGSHLFDAAITKPCDLAHFYRLIEGLAADGGAMPVNNALPDGQRVDHQGTLARLGGNEQLLQDLVRFFLEDAPTVLAELGTSLQRDDAKIAERAAHSLKGLAANFGAREATRLADELQRMGREGDLSAAAPLYRRLETEVNLLRRELEEYQANLAHSRASDIDRTKRGGGGTGP